MNYFSAIVPRLVAGDFRFLFDKSHTNPSEIVKIASMATLKPTIPPPITTKSKLKSTINLTGRSRMKIWLVQWYWTDSASGNLTPQ